RHIEATGTRVVVAGSTPEGTPAVQMSIRGEWRDPVELPQLTGVSAIAGCGDAVCVFDTDTASMLEVSEDGVVGPVRPFTGVVEVVGSASDGGVVYLLARTDAATLQLVRVIV
ncbi:MAG TPA: hypothetical protein DCR14_15160, partial [Acidimicrobiaceae bacterium]|nr:hypothetical protein [Acidimicrobiaceae bacterium]